MKQKNQLNSKNLNSNQITKMVDCQNSTSPTTTRTAVNTQRLQLVTSVKSHMLHINISSHTQNFAFHSHCNFASMTSFCLLWWRQLMTSLCITAVGFVFQRNFLQIWWKLEIVFFFDYFGIGSIFRFSIFIEIRISRIFK